MIVATKRRDVATLALLLDRGGNANARDRRRCPALSTAAANGDLAVVETLLSHAADPKASGDCRFPLVAAADSGYTEIVF